MIKKIFFIGAAPLNSMNGDSMEAHIINGFKTLGIEINYFPIFKGGIRDRINKYIELASTDYHLLRTTPLEKSLIKAAKAFKPDLVFVLLGNYTTPSMINKIRDATSAPAACWCQDHMGTMGRQYILGSKFDYVFAKDQFMVDLFQQYTNIPQVHYLAEACNPRVHTPVAPNKVDLQKYECEVTTAATLYYYRSEILETLTNYDMRIWGPIPRFYNGILRKFSTGKSVYTRDKSACFNSSKIVINSLFPMEFGGLNARAFEIAGCGGFQLISHSDAISKHFIPGKEIETFVDLKDLKDKVTYYLNHEDERKSIAEAGRIRAHKEHTYEIRLKQLLDTINTE